MIEEFEGMLFQRFLHLEQTITNILFNVRTRARRASFNFAQMIHKKKPVFSLVLAKGKNEELGGRETEHHNQPPSTMQRSQP